MRPRRLRFWILLLAVGTVLIGVCIARRAGFARA